MFEAVYCWIMFALLNKIHKQTHIQQALCGKIEFLLKYRIIIFVLIFESSKHIDCVCSLNLIIYKSYAFSTPLPNFANIVKASWALLSYFEHTYYP